MNNFFNTCIKPTDYTANANANTNTNINTTFTPDELKYIESLSLKEYMAFQIAKSHLQTSFHLQKSNGYIHYLKNKNTGEILVKEH
jgi:hypothetical protein